MRVSLLMQVGVLAAWAPKLRLGRKTTVAPAPGCDDQELSSGWERTQGPWGFIFLISKRNAIKLP